MKPVSASFSLRSLLIFLFIDITNTQTDVGRPKPNLSISVSIEPKIPMSRCSGESQDITCQIVDYEAQLPKIMQQEQTSRGYGGYVEFLLFRRTKPDRDSVVNDSHVNYPSELLRPRTMTLNNLTIFDKGEYNCTVMWHGVHGDSKWTSEPFSLNVYDCIQLQNQTIEASVGDAITMQCIDVEAPIKWFKDDDAINGGDTPKTETIVGSNVGSRLKGVPGVKTIQIKSVDDAGIYTCKSTFEDTQQIFTKNTEVRIKTAPTTPININPLRQSPTTVVLQWEQKSVPNKFIVADPTFYTIFYKPIDADTFQSKTVLKNPEVMLTNLKPATVYFVRIQAENELGTSVSGSRIVVTPGASTTVAIDKRLLDLMTEHVKVLDQDLKSIASVLYDIVPHDPEQEVAPTRRPGATGAGGAAGRGTSGK